jgi:glycosyltransferase involved in cell wall biosynthesis
MTRSHTVLTVHNYYQQPGGEDAVFANEARLLEQHGHTVVRYVEHNARIGAGSLITARDAVWNYKSYQSLRLAAKVGLDIAHFHNTFPLISPSAYYAIRQMGVPVVQTLHNYRLLCPAATFLRNGAVCEACPESHSWLPAIRHRCYRDSRLATTAMTAMLTVHNVARTWQSMVNVYIALSEFARNKFIEGGLPPEQIAVKPNFLASDPGVGKREGEYALFVGRLAEEKGVRLLAQAWQRLPDIPLIVAGKGPLDALEWPSNVVVVGHQSREQIFSLMRGARVLVFPSICYECSPMTIIEAFACGLPVIASNIGSVPEYVTHQSSGLLFQPGDIEDLVQQVQWAFGHSEELRDMRFAARREYEENYTPGRNYKMLMDIYATALGKIGVDRPAYEPVA